jgi:ribonuclease BN (tRNA processing enzyme)
MKLTVLGSGTFFVNKTVTASAFLLDTGDKKILIDCGPGTLVKLAQAGIKIEELDYVFITHFHPDHTSDLFPLFMNFRLSDSFTPGSITKFPVFFGPEGIDKFFIDYSKITELLSYEGWGKIKVEEYKPLIELEDIVVRPYKVSHIVFDIQTKSYALRFEADGKTIVFSGDTAMCEGIKDACKNADLFICDTSFPKNKNTTSHMNTTEIGEISQQGKVKKLILDHFYPQFSQYDLVAEIKENYKGEVVKAKDLDVIEF